MRRGPIIFVAIVVLLLVGVVWFFVQSQQQKSDPTDASRCKKAPQNTINAVAGGLSSEVQYNPTTAMIVEIPVNQRDSAGWPQALYAVRVSSPEVPDGIAIWGVGDPRGLVLPITALNQNAIQTSSWGTKGGDVGGDTNRRFASGLAEQRLIDSCVARRPTGAPAT